MEGVTSGDVFPKGRVILQQCLSAKLQVQPATDQKDAKFVEINRGLIVYVCFLKGATPELVSKMVKSTVSARLSETDTGKLTSILELPGDVLVVPQATLGGRLKGKSMQYHSNIDKTEGLTLYTNFITQCTETVQKSEICREKNVTVQYGTFGNRQVLSMVTNGPYSHILEF